VNYAESLGLACLAFGAEAYGTGYATKERRLAVSDHVKRGGGFALPKFYSKNVILDLRPEDDLERFQKAELALLNSDKTPASEPLLNALKAGKKTGVVVPWRQAKNNVAAAELHYLQLHRREGTKAATVAAGAKWLSKKYSCGSRSLGPSSFTGCRRSAIADVTADARKIAPASTFPSEFQR